MADGPLVSNTLQRVALAVFILQKVAAQLRDPSFAALIGAWENNVTLCVQDLLSGKDDGKQKADDVRLYLLHQIYPSHQLVQVLRSEETLDKLGLKNYFVAENILS